MSEDRSVFVINVLFWAGKVMSYTWVKEGRFSYDHILESSYLPNFFSLSSSHNGRILFLPLRSFSFHCCPANLILHSQPLSFCSVAPLYLTLRSINFDVFFLFASYIRNRQKQKSSLMGVRKTRQGERMKLSYKGKHSVDFLAS